MRHLARASLSLKSYWKCRLHSTVGRDSVKQNINFKSGDKLHGYTVTNVSDVPELYLTSVMLKHDATGAQHLHLARDDDENTFSVAFRTTPLDNTGVPHILEHTTLCGSKKFPIRDPFFKMLSRSLATFMNAFTAYDWTMYPFTTQNPKDFKNLLNVYMDAVFYPTLREMDFLQEGWRLESQDSADPKSPLTFKGVVYNEMKGVFSSSQSIFGQAAHNQLYPDHTYGVVSGGDPAYIPDLTYKQLKDFHASHYHPSNARFFTYGNLPLEEHLQFINSNYLNNFKEIKVDTAVPLQPRWSEPRRSHVTCSSDPMAPDQSKQTTVCVNYLLADNEDPFENFTLSTIAELLVSGPTAPFYKSLLEANLGSDYAPVVGLGSSTRESSFAIGLQGINEKDVERVTQIIEETFDKVIKEGFEQKRIDAWLHTMEMALKIQQTNFGLTLSMAVISPWIHDVDPIDALQFNQIVNRFKQCLKDNPRFLQDKVQQYFKNNPHSLTLTMSPDDNYEKQLKKSEAENLQSIVSKLTDEDREKITKRTQELLKDQSTVPDLSCLPTVRVSDVDKNIKRYQVDVDHLVGVPVSSCRQPTNEIVYMKLLCNVADLPSDLYPYLPLFCNVITSMGAGPFDYKDLSEEIMLYTGFLNSGIHLSMDNATVNSFQQGVAFSSCCFERNVDKMLELWTHIFNNPKMEDMNRLITLINMAASDAATGLADSGHHYAMTHSASRLTPEANLQEILGGVTQVETLKKIAKSQGPDKVLKYLLEIGQHVLSKEKLRVFVNTTPEDMDQVLKKTESFLQNLSGTPTPDGVAKYVQVPSFTRASSQTQFELPFSVNYMSKSLPGVAYTDDDNPRLKVMTSLLSRKFLHREIREKGGAYGSGVTSGSGVISFFSFRDPCSMETLNVFEQAAQWAADGSFTDQDIEEAKLAVFQQIDKPPSAGGKGSIEFLTDITDDMRQNNRNKLFQVSRNDLVNTAQKYLLDKSLDVGTSFLGPANTSVQSDKTWKIIKD